MSSPQRGVQSQTIQVNVDLTNYPTRDPQISCTPDEAQMAAGNDTITWIVNPQNVPTGYTVKFAASGIVFKSTSPTFPGTLTRTSDTKYDATDPDTLASGAQPVQYFYTVNITVVDSNSTGRSFAHDPDIENEPQTP